MKAYAAFAVVLAALMLAAFGAAQALHVPLLGEELPDLGNAGIGAAAASVLLLVADVVLPVPSSGVMLVDGALFGVAAGAALSLVGSVGAALLGCALGRRSSTVLERVATPAARARAEALVARRGAVAVVATRPIPVVAETVAIVAGAAGMGYRRMAVAAAIGSLPPAVGYALAGAVAESYGDGLVVLGLVLLLAAAVWLAEGRVRLRRASRRTQVPLG